MNDWPLAKLLASLHDDIQQRLPSLGHPVSKGDASENVWLRLGETYLPRRYQVASAHVVDSHGNFSQQFDVVRKGKELVGTRFPTRRTDQLGIVVKADACGKRYIFRCNEKRKCLREPFQFPSCPSRQSNHRSLESLAILSPGIDDLKSGMVPSS